MSTYDDYVDSLKAYIVKTATKKAFVFLVEKAAFIAWGPIGPLTKMLLKKVISHVVDQGEIAIFFKYIDFRTSAQGRKFSEAITKNKKAQQNGTEEEKRIAEENVKSAFRDLARLTV